eukprot:TRINITY_DN1671_c0_g1_i1.p1 TRINITY_DN1671_c0_g1~~TRINITY_DN1671_c0_g1_i1.p1  ORF type:complete len:204 (+),score=61.23 TRINITY_DN1671_c0_g1_i1:264-875(+)
MREWFSSGFFQRDLQVKRVNESSWGYISGRDEFKGVAGRAAHTAPGVDYNAYYQSYYTPAPYNPAHAQGGNAPVIDQRQLEKEIADEERRLEEQRAEEYEEKRNRPVKGTSARGSYAQKAFFAALNGRYAEQPVEKEPYLRGRNIPTDRDGRMMAHYFDVEAYQEEMRRVSAKPKTKPKLSKKKKEYYRKKKEQKRVKRIMEI